MTYEWHVIVCRSSFIQAKETNDREAFVDHIKTAEWAIKRFVTVDLVKCGREVKQLLDVWNEPAEEDANEVVMKADNYMKACAAVGVAKSATGSTSSSSSVAAAAPSVVKKPSLKENVCQFHVDISCQLSAVSCHTSNIL